MKDEDIVASYADDNMPYVIRDNINQVLSAFQNATTSLFKWFSDNQMKANPDKCHLIIDESCKRKWKIARVNFVSAI